MIPANKNPLRMDLIAKVPFRFDHGDWNSNLLWLKRLNFRAAIVGNKGSGKTTLMAELVRRVENSHYLNLPHERKPHGLLLEKANQASRAGKILFVDGIERISWWQREKIIFRTAGKAGLVVVMHSRCRLPTWVTCRTDETLMAQVVCDLGLNSPSIQDAAIAAFRKTKGNIRDALRLMYDQFANESLQVPASAG